MFLTKKIKHEHLFGWKMNENDPHFSRSSFLKQLVSGLKESKAKKRQRQYIFHQKQVPPGMLGSFSQKTEVTLLATRRRGLKIALDDGKTWPKCGEIFFKQLKDLQLCMLDMLIVFRTQFKSRAKVMVDCQQHSAPFSRALIARPHYITISNNLHLYKVVYTQLKMDSQINNSLLHSLLRNHLFVHHFQVSQQKLQLLQSKKISHLFLGGSTLKTYPFKRQISQPQNHQPLVSTHSIVEAPTLHPKAVSRPCRTYEACFNKCRKIKTSHVFQLGNFEFSFLKKKCAPKVRAQKVGKV